MPVTEVIKRVADACLRTKAEDQGSRHWGDAILTQGILAAYHETGDEAYLAYSREWIDAYIEHGFDPQRWVWFWAGLAPPALALYELTRDERYRQWAKRIADALLNEAPRIKVGGITPHAERPELWVDVPFFVAPGLAMIGALEGDRRYLQEAIHQIRLHTQRLVDDKTGLFYHVWNEETGQRSPCLWGRGNGWLAVSVLETLDYLDDGSREKGAFSAILARQVTSLVEAQDASGLWHTVLDRPDAYLETSCTAIFVYVLARGVRKGYLARGYLRNAREGWLALQERVAWDGRVVGVSMQTPPGPFDFYQSIPTGSEKFGTGLFLLAGLEMARL